jgi:hypothetical protein
MTRRGRSSSPRLTWKRIASRTFLSQCWLPPRRTAVPNLCSSWCLPSRLPSSTARSIASAACLETGSCGSTCRRPCHRFGPIRVRWNACSRISSRTRSSTRLQAPQSASRLGSRKTRNWSSPWTTRGQVSPQGIANAYSNRSSETWWRSDRTCRAMGSDLLSAGPSFSHTAAI